MIIDGFFLANGTFLKSRNKGTFTKHLSPPLSGLSVWSDPTRLLLTFLLPLFPHHCLFPWMSIIPKTQESTVFQMCRNNLSWEHRPQTVGYDLGDSRWCTDAPWCDILSQTEKTIPFQLSFMLLISQREEAMLWHYYAFNTSLMLSFFIFNKERAACRFRVLDTVRFNYKVLYYLLPFSVNVKDRLFFTQNNKIIFKEQISHE